MASTQAGVFVEAAVPSPENGGGAGVEHLLQGVLFAKHAIYFKSREVFLKWCALKTAGPVSRPTLTGLVGGARAALALGLGTLAHHVASRCLSQSRGVAL